MAGRLTSPRTLVVGSLNVRGCSSIESKRSEIGCMFGRRGMDVLTLCETKMKGKGEVAFGEVTGRVSGVERGRAREGVALLLSEWMGNKVVEWKEVSSRLMWVRVRMGRECWAFVSAYGPGCERSEVEGVVGKYGVPGENESGERLLDMCVERELVIGNSLFKKKEINKYTWIRVANGRVIERALMDYVLITKRMVGRLKDVHVFRGVAAGMSDHFLVEAEVVVAKEWGNRVVGCRREVVKVEELKKPEKKQEYQDKLKEAYDRVKEREAGELEEEWMLMKESLVGYASDVCGKRFVGGCMRRSSEWWNEGVKMKVEEKKRAFEEWLQCNSVEKYERYREKNVEAKRKVEEVKRMSNFKWGQDFDRSYEENKKKFWKEVRRVKKGGSRTEETVKDVNGRLLRGNEARK